MVGGAVAGGDVVAGAAVLVSDAAEPVLPPVPPHAAAAKVSPAASPKAISVLRIVRPP